MVQTWDEIMTTCNISYSAAINREQDIKTSHYIINTPWDENILLQINKISKHCTICKNSITTTHSVYCPTCGSNL